MGDTAAVPSVTVTTETVKNTKVTYAYTGKQMQEKHILLQQLQKMLENIQ